MAERSEALRYTSVDSPLGRLFLAVSDRGLRCVCLSAGDDEAFRRELARTFGDRAGAAQRDDSLRETLAGAVRRWFEEGRAALPLDLPCRSEFERRVLEAVGRIPRGQVRTYGEIAGEVGRPGAARAVGQVMARNPLPLFIPCHRVVGAGGRLGSYSGGGPAVKRRLLELEGCGTPLR